MQPRPISPEPFDVLVVGAGPAGSAAALAALTAHPTARVALVDAASFPRDKACGDGVAGSSVAELHRLGVPDVVAGYAPVDRLRLRTPGGHEVVAIPREASYVIPRQVLDDRLMRAAVERGAELIRHRVRRVEVADDVVTVGPGLSGRVVIAADGANSTVRRALGFPPNPDDALAVAMRAYANDRAMPADGQAGVPEQLIHMTEEDWPAYAWSFPIGDGRANIGFGMLRSSLAGRGRRDLLEPMARLLPGQRIEDGTARAAYLPLSTWRPRQPDGRVLLVGDAASLINPLTGEGIFYALLSGRLAGEVAVTSGGAAAGGVFRRRLRRELGAHLALTTLLAAVSRRPGHVDSAVALGGRDPVAMDALVEVGLGRGLLPPALAGRLLIRLAGRLLRPG